LVTEDPILDLRSVRSVSHALDGLLRHRPLQVCFALLPRPGFSPSGVCPSLGSRSAFPLPLPSVLSAAPTAVARAVEIAFEFRALLFRASAVVIETGESPVTPRPLLGFASSGYFSCLRCGRFRVRSVLAVR
jgi:hypothetical protein